MVATLERPKTQTQAEQRTLYKLWPKQRQAMELLGLDGPSLADPTARTWAVEELLYGGQAGGGKSHLARAVGVSICLAWPGAVVPIFRRTYPELEESHIRWIQQEVGAPIATYHQGRRELRFFNGSILEFRHADDEAAVYGYNTAEWAALIVDQAEAFTEFQLRFLRTRVRQPKASFGGAWRPLILYSANPGGASHLYLRDGFVERAAAGEVFTAPPADGGMRRVYLPARLSDNPSLDADDYRKRLMGLPEHLVRAYMDGDWSAVVGAYFVQWRATDLDGNPWHVWPEDIARAFYDVPDDEPFPPKDWVTWGGVDGGTRDPWCVELGARAPDGRIFVWKELFQPGVEVPDQAKRLAEIQKERRIAKWAADPAMFANRANMSVSDAQIYAEHGVYLERGNNKREQGWRRLSEGLSETMDDGYPAVVVIEGRCPHLVRTLPLLLTDPLKHEDVSSAHGKADPRSPSSIRDDPGDALRYLITPASAPSTETRVLTVNAQMDGAMHRPDREGREPTHYADLNQSGISEVWR